MRKKRLAGIIASVLAAAASVVNPVFAGTIEISDSTGVNGLFDVVDSAGVMIAFAHETKDHIAKDGSIWICADPLKLSFYYGNHTTVDAKEVISGDLLKEVALGRRYIETSGVSIGRTNPAGLAQIYTWMKLKGTTWGESGFDIYPTGGKEEFAQLLPKVEAYVKEQFECFDAGGELSYTPDRKKYQMTFNVWLKDRPKIGKAYITKSLDSLTELQLELPQIYTAKGVTFGVWSEPSLSDASLAGTLTTADDGKTSEIELEAGRTYYVKEISCPDTINRSEEVVEVAVAEGDLREIRISDKPKAAKNALLVRKKATNGAEMPVAGAIYEIAYFGARDTSEKPLRRWRFTTDEKGCISFGYEQFAGGDEFYKDADGDPVLPIGNYTTREIAAPEGYFLSEETVSSDVSLVEGNAVYSTARVNEKPVPVIATKALFEGGFKCGQAKENMVVTDTVSCRYLSEGADYTVKGRLIDAEDETLLAEASSTFTAATHDETVEVTFLLNGISLAGRRLVVAEELYEGEELVCVHSDMQDSEQTVYVAEIGTTLTSDGRKTIAPTGEASVVDVAEYRGLDPDGSYELRGTLVRKDTGETVAKSRTAFNADATSGTAEVKFDFDASKIAGTDVVAFEELYAVDGERESLVAEHRDINSKGQTVSIESQPQPPITGYPGGKGLFTWLSLLAAASAAVIVYCAGRSKARPV